MTNPAQAADVFDSWRRVLEVRPELAAQYPGTYKFIVEGGDNEAWLLDCAESRWDILQVSPDSEAQFTVSASPRVLRDLSSGAAFPAQCLVEGSISASGDVEVGMQLGMLLKEFSQTGHRMYH
ncbi:MAG: SCP2 sterol-binding domain-containing protein [Bdellovibrionales bacterium]|nr:SCP2 sterol-binding domain-containing protein [Bdellovibrionales bacterium]